MEKFVPKKTSKESGISKIISTNEEDKRFVFDFFKEEFENHVLGDDERPKTNSEIKVAKTVLSHMEEFVSMYGGEFPPLQPDHVHTLDPKKITENTQKFGAGYIRDYQRIYLQDQYTSDFIRAHVLAHEFLHFISFQSFSLVRSKDDKDFIITTRRLGLDIVSDKNNLIFFSGLGEAVIDELASTFDRTYLYKEKYLVDDLNRNLDYKTDLFLITKSNEGETVFESLVYKKEKDYLRRLINDLYEKNRDQFHLPDEVFILFARAVLSGELLPLARLIEKTYGKGSFRDLGKVFAEKIDDKK